MAHKRMFSKDITTSDAFREMPSSSQSLYFHLGMEADDDGFLDNYKGLMRAVNATDDDLKILIAKRFLILFPSKVVVVKHWLLNNTIRKDRYTETKHLEEKRALIVKENGSYTDDLSGLPSGNQMATQKRIEEDRREEFSVAKAPREVTYEKDEETKPKKTKRVDSHILEVFALVGGTKYPKFWETIPAQRSAAEWLYEEKETEQIQKAMDFARENRSKPFFAKIHTPYDLMTKWEKLLDAKENGI